MGDDVINVRTQVLRRALIPLVVAVLAVPATAAAATELMPGVEYRRQAVPVRGGVAVYHVVTAPKPGGLYSLEPILSNNLILGRETVTRMQRRLSGQATAVGVNGDLFNWSTGHPSGIYLREGVLASRPIGDRSSLGIGVDGLLRIARINFFGWIRLGDADKQPLAQFNRPQTEENGIALYTSRWGAATPRSKGAVDLVLAAFPRAEPNVDLTAQVAEVRRGGRTPIPAGGAVLQATGFWADRVRPLAAPGVTLTTRLILRPWWQSVEDAIGGGPVLVRRGKPVRWAGEAFRSYVLSGRYPRTAVGQLADGRIILVTVDARRSWSRGVTVPELAQQMARFGAVTAMALDAGGSTTIAFDGDVLNRPSGGSERPVGDALMVLYTGAFAPEPRHRVLSPNGDGVAERQRLAYKVVKPSTVSVSLVDPAGTVVWQDAGAREPGTVGVAPASETLAQEGTWTWTVSAVDADGIESTSTRSFAVNNTLGFLRLSKSRLRVPARRKARVTASFELAHEARVTVSVLRRGRLVRRLHRGETKPGKVVLRWNGRDRRGRRVPSGRYEVHVKAKNELGEVELERKLTVKKLPARKKQKRR